MTRKVADVDKALAFYVERRRRSRQQISQLSALIVSDTRSIDQLLVERIAVLLDDLTAQL